MLLSLPSAQDSPRAKNDGGEGSVSISFRWTDFALAERKGQRISAVEKDGPAAGYGLGEWRWLVGNQAAAPPPFLGPSLSPPGRLL